MSVGEAMVEGVPVKKINSESFTQFIHGESETKKKREKENSKISIGADVKKKDNGKSAKKSLKPFVLVPI